jgi:hypothetical protein
MGIAHRGKELAFLRPNSSGVTGHHQDVAWLSFTDHSPFVAVVSVPFHSLPEKQKTLLTRGKQGCGNLCSIRYLLTSPVSKFVAGIGRWFDPNPDLDSAHA